MILRRIQKCHYVTKIYQNNLPRAEPNITSLLAARSLGRFYIKSHSSEPVHTLMRCRSFCRGKVYRFLFVNTVNYCPVLNTSSPFPISNTIPRFVENGMSRIPWRHSTFRSRYRSGVSRVLRAQYNNSCQFGFPPVYNLFGLCTSTIHRSELSCCRFRPARREVNRFTLSLLESIRYSDTFIRSKSPFCLLSNSMSISKKGRWCCWNLADNYTCSK